MKDANGRGVIRLGDQTSHGGQVISASDTLRVLGKSVALDGHMVSCPKCKGIYTIQASGSTNKHNGKNIAFSNDLTTCGAQLISSI